MHRIAIFQALCRGALLCLLSASFIISLHGQVRIKEKVTINPRAAATSSVSRTLTVVFSRPAGLIEQKPCDPTPTGKLQNGLSVTNGSCGVGGTVDLGGGAGSISVAAVSGRYDAASVMNWTTEGIATVDAFLDDVQIEHYVYERAAASGCSYCQEGPSEPIVFESSIHIGSGLSSILHGDQNSFGINPGNRVICEANAWYQATDPVTVRISAGEQYGNLYHSDGTLIGTSYTGTLSDIARSGCFYRADGDEPPPEGGTVTVTAEVANAGISSSTSFTIAGTDCNPPPTCSANPLPPPISINEVANSFDGIDACSERANALGVFKPASGGTGGGFAEAFSVDACYDPVARHWRYIIPELKINAIVDLCPGHFGTYQPISDVTQVVGNKCCALTDFQGHRHYPISIRSDGYLLLPVLLAHERRHEQDYLDLLLSMRSSFDEALRGVTPTCETYDTQQKAQEHGDRFVRGYLSNFISEVNYEWDKRTKRPGYEDQVQNDIWLQYLIDIYEETLAVDPSTCREVICQ